MFIGKELKENNIAEYLLYMWQVEDLIRAYEGDIDRLREGYLKKFNLDEPQEREQEQWYADRIDMMRQEGVMQSGHLQVNKNVEQTLSELHLMILKSGKYPFYTAAYYKTLPYIVELRSRSGKKEVTEVETCFDALYGVMMLRLQGKPVHHDTVVAMQEITKLMGMLADYYKKDKAGELDF